MHTETEDEAKYLSSWEQYHYHIDEWRALVQQRKGKKYQLHCSTPQTRRDIIEGRDIIGYFSTREEANKEAFKQIHCHTLFDDWGATFYANKPPPYTTDDGPVDIVGTTPNYRNPEYVNIFIVDVEKEYTIRKQKEKESARIRFESDRIHAISSKGYGLELSEDINNFGIWNALITIFKDAGYDIDERSKYDDDFLIEKLVLMDRRLFEETIEKSLRLHYGISQGIWKLQLYYYYHHLEGQTLEQALLVDPKKMCKDEKAIRTAQIYPRGSKDRAEQIKSMVNKGDVSSRHSMII